MTYSEYICYSFHRFWYQPFLCDYPNITLTYKEVAYKIMQIHEMFKVMDIKEGDKIALCGKNSSNWGIVYLSIASYGAVAVPLSTDFDIGKIEFLLKHSESKLFFVDDDICRYLHPDNMSDMYAIYSLNTLSLVLSPLKDIYAIDINRYNVLNFSKNKFCDTIYKFKSEELVAINYTSGTSSNPKGVMIPSRAISSNLGFALDVMSMLHENVRTICLLPMSHMFGLMYDFLGAMVFGGTVHFLNDRLTIKSISTAYKKIKPHVVIIVPIIIENIIRNTIFKYTKNHYISPVYSIFRKRINKLIKKKLMSLFGNNFYQIIVGGAYLDKEVEDFLREINMPFTVGYGMTECSPIITYNDYNNFITRSCGKSAPNMEIKIDNRNNEILVRGKNLFLGYYKNKRENKDVFTKDGWFKTGDEGIIDDNGNLYIRGRLKNTIIGNDGKNINPEEIEEIINKDNYIDESLVFNKDNKLQAYIHLNYNTINNDGILYSEINNVLEQKRIEINKNLPQNYQITKFLFTEQPFKKTQKGEIKRYLYHKN